MKSLTDKLNDVIEFKFEVNDKSSTKELCEDVLNHNTYIREILRAVVPLVEWSRYQYTNDIHPTGTAKDAELENIHTTLENKLDEMGKP